MTRTDVPIDSNRVLWIDSINQLFKCYLVIRNVISLQLLYLVVLSSLKAILPDACTLLPIAQQLQSSLVPRECDIFPCGTLPVLYTGPGQNGSNLRMQDGNCDKSF